MRNHQHLPAFMTIMAAVNTGVIEWDYKTLTATAGPVQIHLGQHDVFEHQTKDVEISVATGLPRRALKHIQSFEPDDVAYFQLEGNLLRITDGRGMCAPFIQTIDNEVAQPLELGIPIIALKRLQISDYEIQVGNSVVLFTNGDMSYLIAAQPVGQAKAA